MKIVAISDTHTKHRDLGNLPKGDCIIHSGDIMGSGFNYYEVLDFVDWFRNLDYKYKILVAGNHDRMLDEEHYKNTASRVGCYMEGRTSDCERLFRMSKIIYLNDSGIELEGIKFWGSPIQPEFCNWAFNRDRGIDIRQHWDLIPKDTDVLITHGPVFGIGDRCANGFLAGCEDLLETVEKIKPKFHIFGHIHEGYGMYIKEDCVHINASILDENYRLKNKPVEFIIKTL